MRISIRVICVHCDTDLTELPGDGRPTNAGFAILCGECGGENIVPTEDIREVQHRALVMLGEA